MFSPNVKTHLLGAPLDERISKLLQPAHDFRNSDDGDNHLP